MNKFCWTGSVIQRGVFRGCFFVRVRAILICRRLVSLTVVCPRLTFRVWAVYHMLRGYCYKNYFASFPKHYCIVGVLMFSYQQLVQNLVSLYTFSLHLKLFSRIHLNLCFHLWRIPTLFIFCFDHTKISHLIEKFSFQLNQKSTTLKKVSI